MGAFYTNVTLLGPNQKQVVEYLNQIHRDTYVSPTINGYTMVYDLESEAPDATLLSKFAAQLSKQFGCATLGVMDRHDTALVYKLYEVGALVDAYSSDPNYIDNDVIHAPSQGDAKKLCAACGAGQAVELVDAILKRAGAWDDNGYAVEQDRHYELVQALGIPLIAVGLGYNYINEGNVPEEVEISLFVRTK